MMKIGIAGYAGSGKDTAAKMLSTIIRFKGELDYEIYVNNSSITPHNVSIVKFGDDVKVIARHMFDLPRYFFDNRNTKECIVDLSTGEVVIDKPNEVTKLAHSFNYNKDLLCMTDTYVYSRSLLTFTGDLMKATFGESYWVNKLLNKINCRSTFEYVIIPDVRYEVERDITDITIKIVNDVVSKEGSHSSEKDLKLREQDVLIVWFENKPLLFNSLLKLYKERICKQ